MRPGAKDSGIAAARRRAWKSSGQLEKFLPGSERGWPVGLDKGASPIFLAAGAAGFVRMFHLLWCADMECDVTAAALLDTAGPLRQRRVTCSPGEKFACSSIWNRGQRARCSRLVRTSPLSTSPYRRDDEQPVRNLADFVRIHPDDWETAHAALTAAAAPQNPFVP